MNKSQIIKEANQTLVTDGNLNAVGNFFTSDYTVHITGHDFEGGHKIARTALSELRKSFPDIHVDVEILVEGKERVAWQRTFQGTHKGNFKGFPATGLKIVWRDMVTSRFREGLIAEEWVVTDLAERLLLSQKRKS